MLDTCYLVMTCWDYSVSKVFGFQPKVTKYMVWCMIVFEGRLGMRRCALGPLLIHCQEHIVNQALLLHFPNHLYPYRYTWHFWFPVKNIYSHPGVPCTDLKLLVVPFQEQYQPTSCTWNCSVFSLVKNNNPDDRHSSSP